MPWKRVDRKEGLRLPVSEKGARGRFGRFEDECHHDGWFVILTGKLDQAILLRT